MQALVLEPDLSLNIRDIEIAETLGPRDVRIQVHTVGICGSDIHYYQHGRIGPFVIQDPLVLGHEASGVVTETGAEVTSLAPGDRVCMEPGVPPADSRAGRLGLYNLDPGVLFWATPPVHGVLRPSVVHPAEFTYKLPESVSFGEGAMVEPLAIGMQAATKAQVAPGDLAVVLGAGTIGAMTTLAALAAGCSHVVVTDVKQAKLDLVARSGPVTTVNVAKDSLTDVIDDLTDGWGADVVFECSGSEKAIAGVFEPLRPGGRVVLVGMPIEPVPFDVVAAQSKEATVATVFRYANVYPRTIALLAGGKVDLKPFITDVFSFEDSVKAFDWALDMPETSVKAQIEMP